jgi:general stress protein 26
MDKIRNIVNDAGFGSLATSLNGCPKVRPMAFVMLDDGRLWSSTYDISGKVAEFKKNNRVEVCFVDSQKNHARIEGTVNVSSDSDKKRKLLELNPKVKRHFKDEHDPKFVLIEIIPEKIKWTEPGFGEYHLVEV